MVSEKLFHCLRHCLLLEILAMLKQYLRCYHWVLDRARHPQAPWLLFLISFLDSIFLPCPPLAMAVPMIQANPQITWKCIVIMIVGSIVGGALGYCFGFFFFQAWVGPILEKLSWTTHYNQAIAWLQERPFQAPLWGGMSPIPFKFFTIGAGMMRINVCYFAPAILLGRSFRLILVACLTQRYGQKIEGLFRQYYRPSCFLILFIGVIYYVLS